MQCYSVMERVVNRDIKRKEYDGETFCYVSPLEIYSNRFRQNILAECEKKRFIKIRLALQFHTERRNLKCS